MPSVLPAARALCLAAVTLLAVAPTATADDGWSVVPSTGGQDGRPYFYAEGAPGTVMEDTVSVINPGRDPLTVRLRGADADNSRGGGLSVRAKATDTGAWITFAERTVKIPARTRADVPFTVSVPVGTTPGDHPGAIVATGAGRSAAVRVHLRVGGPTLSALTVEDVAVRAGRISYELVNRGTTVLTPKLAVRAEGLFGEVLDRAPRTLPVELLPGRRVTLTEPWPDRPALDSVEVKVTVTAAGGARDEAGASARFVPWGAVAGVVGGLVVCAGGGHWFVGRFVRRRRRPPPQIAGAEQPRTEDELTGAVS
ncbi:COG1470 family protein [Streptomyces sp. 2A115]|uniref:COG1470 family protein n=1 Tax=Streptomyces sp. 2A115 TaxID=3457439 RepID=UPI003FD47F5A